jgi:DedD protein
MNESQDTEINLSTGKLLGLFTGLIVVCALFFGFGYSLGRGAAKQEGSLIAADGTSATAPNGANKPGAAAAQAKPPDCPAGQNCTQQNASPQDLTFYKAVEQKEANTALDSKEEAQTSTPPTSSTPAPFAKKAPAPEMKGVPPVAAPFSGYMVQVAAVSKKEDADMLRSALQQKRYPVVVTAAPSDRLFHVQVGPFAELKDAEAMKSRLTGDGYSPIVKK